ncbi:MAG: anthranilate synthase component I family protein [Cyclobacteriaceae bacterium]|nr:anthranilate synthase component I family protein [Cyclobacteriaceae bacterium]
MKNFTIHVQTKKLLADTITPVSVYLRLRDLFAGTLLLESSDYHGEENSLSLICFDPIATFTVQRNEIRIKWPDKTSHTFTITVASQVPQLLEQFRKSFTLITSSQVAAGMFGYLSYDSVRFFEDVQLQQGKQLIPELQFGVYRFIIVIDHFHNDMQLIELQCNDSVGSVGLNDVERIVFNARYPHYSFRRINGEVSNFTDGEFLQRIHEAIRHCHRGNVFQLVLSRRFETGFRGDEFNVYRALRSINPSPYLFYFDYGNFRIFGSSPEAQVQIRNREVRVYPIAGTFRRTGDDNRDAELAHQLAADIKENAEHNMLVDLARNDLSRFASKVTVEVFKEIQFYSHVIHLVSKVTGKLPVDFNPVQVAGATFPAGTLSGAPRHKAISLIDELENENRSFYGGAIGYVGFDGSVNLAILIRSFLSMNNTLIYQAGAGIVARSNPENELQEVNNKLAALRKAMELAETI